MKHLQICLRHYEGGRYHCRVAVFFGLEAFFGTIEEGTVGEGVKGAFLKTDYPMTELLENKRRGREREERKKKKRRKR